jgi:hypothetical protein
MKATMHRGSRSRRKAESMSLPPMEEARGERRGRVNSKKTPAELADDEDAPDDELRHAVGPVRRTGRVARS